MDNNLFYYIIVFQLDDESLTGNIEVDNTYNSAINEEGGKLMIYLIILLHQSIDIWDDQEAAWVFCIQNNFCFWSLLMDNNFI